MFTLVLLTAISAPPEIAPPPRLLDPDAADKRSMRWVLRFKIQDGKDYLSQVRHLEATLLVPCPGENDCIYFPDLSDLTTRRTATNKDLEKLAEHIRFSDSRKEAVGGIAAEVKLNFTPEKFFACFPRDIEDDLARKERAYRGQKPFEIEQTIFLVKASNKKAEITVMEQTLKKTP